ncbi:hypothetical protein RFN58_06735 [Streptomyces iakyrus]|uniref:hypothetical protein n=1 Tax=Streptomyces iakyrus TaxID=68219 RepID=UPI0012FF15F6|nr:hypothetical protein [Streptomyces iakyrus]
MRRITATVEAFVAGETRTSSSAEASALALLPLPRVASLSGLQARGAACVWCQTRLTIETAVDLGERPGPSGVTVFPRGCDSCVQRLAARVYRIHIANCRACLRNQPCPDRRALRSLASEGAR